jgi:spermidine/putrescine transport system permease protein
LKNLLRFHSFALLGFLYLPLLVLVVFSLNSSRFAVWQGFTWHWYIDAFRNEQLKEATTNSLVIGVCATILSTGVSVMAAYALWKRRSQWFTNSLYLSLLTPEIIAGISLLAFFQWIFRFLHVQLGMHTVILAHISFSIAYGVIVILARLRTFDATLEEAAFDLGANEWQTFRYVTFPNLLPAIVAAGLLCFAVSFDDYVITSLVAGVDSETLPMVIYSLARKGVSPIVNALAAMITVSLGALILIAERLQQRTAPFND